MLDDERRSMLKYGAYHSGLTQMVKLLNGQFYFSRSNFSFNSSKKKILKIRKEKNRALRNVIKVKKTTIRIPIVKPTGRFFSTFSFLNKTVRDLLHFDGEKLEQIDVKNCVIYMLSNYLQGKYSFSQSMLKAMTTKQYFASYSYGLIKTCLAEQGFNLVLEDFRDIQLPISQFCTIKNMTNSNLIPISGFSSYSFQLTCVPGDSNLIETLPARNLLKASQRVGPSLLPGYKPTEMKIGSISIIKGSIPNLGLKRFSNNLSPTPYYTSIPDMTKVFFIKSPLTPLTSEISTIRKNLRKEKDFIPTLGFSLSCSYMIPQTTQNLMDRELELFQEMAVSGMFYENFIVDFKGMFTNDEWKEKYEDRTKLTYTGTYLEERELTKQMIMSLIYARNENSNYNEIKWAFVKQFPLVYLLINDLKTENHKQFAHALFNLEAEVMLDEIAQKLLKSKINCFTVHDCIAVKKSDVPNTLGLMMQIFKDKFGVEPEIHFDNDETKLLEIE